MAQPAVDCIIYRCAKQPEMYLYRRADFPIEEIPEALCQRTGELTEVMALTLTPQRALAREDVSKVMHNLLDQGVHIQMPPNPLQVNLYAGD